VLAIHLVLGAEKIITRRLLVQKELRMEVYTQTDCTLKTFETIWTRFPFSAAIERDNLSRDIRFEKSITLVSDV